MTQQPVSTKQIHDHWCGSEKACRQWLREKGLTGKNGRIFKDGKPLPLPNYYGCYSEGSWIVRLIEDKEQK